MDLQKINKLDIEIARQSAVVRYAGYSYLLSGVGRYANGLLIFIGLVTSNYWIGSTVFILGLIALPFSIMSFKSSYRALQAEERALIELQTRRSALWVEMMAKE